MKKLVYVIGVDVPDEATHQEVVDKAHKKIVEALRTFDWRNDISIHVDRSADLVLKAATKNLTK